MRSLVPYSESHQGPDGSIILRGGGTAEGMWPFMFCMSHWLAFYVSLGRVMTLFVITWSLDAPRTSVCYTANINTEGKERHVERCVLTTKQAGR